MGGRKSENQALWLATVSRSVEAPARRLKFRDKFDPAFTVAKRSPSYILLNHASRDLREPHGATTRLTSV